MATVDNLTLDELTDKYYDVYLNQYVKTERSIGRYGMDPVLSRLTKPEFKAELRDAIEYRRQMMNNPKTTPEERLSIRKTSKETLVKEIAKTDVLGSTTRQRRALVGYFKENYASDFVNPKTGELYSDKKILNLMAGKKRDLYFKVKEEDIRLFSSEKRKAYYEETGEEIDSYELAKLVGQEFYGSI